MRPLAFDLFAVKLAVVITNEGFCTVQAGNEGTFAQFPCLTKLIPEEYRKNPARQFHKLSKEAEEQLELKVKHLEMELEYTKKLIALIQTKDQIKRNIK